MVARTYDEAAHVTAGSKALLVAEKLADEDALSYAMDASADEWSLRDYVAKGIEVLGDGERLLHDVRGRQDRLGVPCE